MPNLEKKSSPSESEIKEFWEWSGFKLIHEPLTPIHRAKLQYPDGTKKQWNGWPSIDLNNLFKYPVPKAIEYLQQKSSTICPPLRYSEETALIVLFQKWLNNPSTLLANPALALFWTIREVIQETK